MKTIRLLFLVAISFAFSHSSYATWAYKDVDTDGWAGVVRDITDAQIPTFIAGGWLISPTRPPVDCNDANPTVWENVKLWIDNDGDKRVVGYEGHCVGNTLPAGRIRTADVLGYSDCNDNDPGIWRIARIFQDSDGDKWTEGSASSVLCIGNVPAGYVITSEVLGFGDCNDADPAVWRKVGLLFDNDGDLRVIINTPLTYLCIGTNPPPKYIFPANRLGISDCNDNNPNAWRSACAKPIGALGPNITVCIPGLIMPPGYEECIRPEAEEIITFSVYPNPATDRVYMMPEQDLKERVEVKLMDAYGRVIRMVNAPNAVKGQNLSINTSNLKPGLYRIAIQSGNTIVSKTIAVKL
jgi:hypothetical protein